ncbi:hypothetical protein YK48G_04170 [Lentilactobacillus fungorum]|uniref:Uncharacterized protein n=1 Tax=Lentilactobacillus fungorum TaxID=2201250 RepID=A0ABQ3VXQ3_9LACO|nr:hypothetical protein YK48G_04170 [Lentilactobacillus fungorum]
MAIPEHRNFPAHPHKLGPKTVIVHPSKRQPGYKRSAPRHIKK